MSLDLNALRAISPVAVMTALGYELGQRYSGTLEYRLADDRKINITLAPRNAKQGGEFMFQVMNGESFRRGKPGGAGAIDLVMAVEGKDFKAAIAWLAETFLSGTAPVQARPIAPSATQSRQTLPELAPEGLRAMHHYLGTVRRLPAWLIDPLIEEGTIYPNIHRYQHQGMNRAFVNAVFVMRDDADKSPVGAMVRGCYDGVKPRKSTLLLATGQSAAFWIGVPLFDAAHVVITESAIECLSYAALHRNQGGLHCRTYGGNRWRHVRSIAPRLADKDFICAFNNDTEGNRAAAELQAMCPEWGIPALSFDMPETKDWNDALKAVATTA